MDCKVLQFQKALSPIVVTVGACVSGCAQSCATNARSAHIGGHCMQTESALENGAAGKRSYAEVLRDGKSLVTGRREASVRKHSLLSRNR